METCIYCLEAKPEAAFNREHVIPQSFGKFENNFVLRCVCTDCNTFFDRELDRKLACDAYEGFDRFRLGLKKPSQYRTLGKKSTTRVEIQEEGETKGVICKATPSPDGQSLGIEPLPQVGFAMCENGPFKYYLLDDLPAKEELATRGFKEGQVFVRCWGTTIEEALDRLEKKGYPQGEATGQTAPPQGHVYCESVFLISQPEFRAVAKIAFNYLAFIAGAAVARMAEFNAVRRYVRYGEAPGTLVSLDKSPPLQRRSTGKPVMGHYLMVQRSDNRVVAEVSLHCKIRYTVLLSDGPFLLAFSLWSAHVFDLETKTIATLPPPGASSP